MALYLENFYRDLHALVMLRGADGWSRCRRPCHVLLHVLQSCILLLLMLKLLLPLTLLLLLQLVSHQLHSQPNA